MNIRVLIGIGLLAGMLSAGNAWAACAEPIGGCQNDFEKAQLQIRPNGTWHAKWLKGTVTPGDHGATTSYDVCIYDADGLVLNLTAEAGDNWTVPEEGKAKYKNDENVLRKMKVKSSGDVSLGKINAKGRTEESVLPLNVVDNVLVQYVRRVEGVFQECWETDFDDSNVKKDSEKKFQARTNNKGGK